MIKSIEIEWLKSKRTKAYISSLLLTLVGILWEASAKWSQITRRDIHDIKSLFNDQTVEVIVLPMIVTLFIIGIVRNEYLGNTFKLQMSNGQTLLNIFKSKLFLSLLFFFALSIIEMSLVSIIGFVNGIQLNLGVIFIKFTGLMLSYMSLSLLYLTLAMLINKQGLVLGLGFLGSFFGIVLIKFSSFLGSFFLPWLGASYLAPYHFTGVNDNGAYEFLATQNLMIRFLLYIIFIILGYYIAMFVIKRKGGQNV